MVLHKRRKHQVLQAFEPNGETNEVSMRMWHAELCLKSMTSLEVTFDHSKLMSTRHPWVLVLADTSPDRCIPFALALRQVRHARQGQRFWRSVQPDGEYR